MQTYRAPKCKLPTFSKALSGTAVPAPSGSARAVTTARTMAGGTQTLRAQKAGSTKGKITTIEVFSKEKAFRPKVTGSRPQPKLLTRIQELRLLSKLEQAGLLSLLERNGLTLTAIENSGLLTTAENLGLISAAADRSTPPALYTVAAALLSAGPTLVYFVPDSSGALVAAQALGALACVLGGSAAFGAASLLSSLQK